MAHLLQTGLFPGSRGIQENCQAEELAEQMAKLDDKKVRIRAKKVPENGVIVKGIENCLVRISRCCNPVPGDEIIGYITRGRVFRYIERTVLIS